MPLVVADLVARLGADTSGFDAGMAKANKTIQGMSSGGIAKGVAGGLFATQAIKAAVGGLKDGIGLAVTFQKQISGILAVGGQDAIKNADAIRAKALELGKATVYSASEAAGGMEELIKAGLPVKSVMDGAAAAALNLAAATGSAVPQAAGLIATSMNAFKATMGQFGATTAKQATHVADVLAEAANASAADISDLGYGFENAEAVAASFGLTVDDLAKSVGILTNQGMQGAMAGSSLKSMFTHLENPTKTQTAAIHKLNLEYTDFYDTTGHFIGIPAMFDKIRNAAARTGQNQQQVNAIMGKMFGTYGINAAEGFFNTTDQGWADFTQSMNKAGTAQDEAKTRLDNVFGSMEMLRGSLETLAVDLGSKLLGPLKVGIQFLTGIVNGILDANDAVKAAIVTFGSLVIVIGSIGTAAYFLGPLLAAIVTPVGLIAAGVAAIVAVGVGAWVGNWFGFRDALMPIVKLVETFGSNLKDAFDSARKGLNPITAGFHAVADALRSITDGNTPGFVKQIADLLDRAGDAALRFGNRLHDILGRGKNPLEAAFLALGQALSTLTGINLVPFFRQFDHGFKMIASGVGDFIGAIVHGDWQKASDLLAGGLQKVGDAVLRLLRSGIDKLKSIDLGKIALNVANWTIGKIPDVWKWLKDHVGPKLLALGRVAVSIAGWLKDTAFPNVFAWLKTAVLPVGGKALLALGHVAVSIAGWAKDTAFPVVWEWLKTAVLPAGGKAVLALGSVTVSVAGWLKDTALPDVWAWLQTTVLPVGGKALLALGSVAVSVAGWLKDTAFPDVWTWLTTAVLPATGKALLALGSVSVSVAGWLKDDGFPDLWAWLKTAVLPATGRALLALGSVAVDIAGWAIGQIPNLWDWLKSQVGLGGGAPSPGLGGFVGQGAGGIDLGSVLVQIGDWLPSPDWPSILDFVTNAAKAALSAGIAVGTVAVGGIAWVLGTGIPNLLDWLKSKAVAMLNGGAPSPGLGGVAGQGQLDLGNVFVKIGDWLQGQDWPSVADFVTTKAKDAIQKGIALGTVIVGGIEWTLDKGVPNFDEWLGGQIDKMLQGSGTGPMLGALHGASTSDKVETAGYNLGVNFADLVDRIFKNLTIAPSPEQGTKDGHAAAQGFYPYLDAFVTGFEKGIADEIAKQIGVEWADIEVPIGVGTGQYVHVNLTNLGNTTPNDILTLGPHTQLPAAVTTTAQATLPKKTSGAGLNEKAPTDFRAPIGPTLPPTVTALPNVGAGPNAGITDVLKNAITTGAPAVQAAWQTLLTGLTTALSTTTNQWITTASTTMGALGGVITNGSTAVQTAFTAALQTVSTAISTATNQWITTIATTLGAMANAAGNGSGRIVAAIRAMIDQIIGVIGSGTDAAVVAGSDFTIGFARGIASGASAVAQEATKIATTALDSVRTAIDSASPAKKTIAEGQNFSSGFQIGIDSGVKAAAASAANLGSGALAALGGSYPGLDQKFGLDDVVAKRLAKMSGRGVGSDRAYDRIRDMFGFGGLTPDKMPPWFDMILGLSPYGSFYLPGKTMSAHPWDFGGGTPQDPGFRPDNLANAIHSLLGDPNAVLGNRGAPPLSSSRNAAPAMPQSLDVSLIIQGDDLRQWVIGQTIVPLAAAADSVGSRGILSGQ